MTVEEQGVRFTDDVTFSATDSTGDGLSEVLVARLEVELLRGGAYAFMGVIRKNGEIIVNRPAWESMLFSSARLDEPAGTYTIELAFSGEAIRRSEEDGPYELLVSAVGEDDDASMTVETPAYDHTTFGEEGG